MQRAVAFAKSMNVSSGSSLRDLVHGVEQAFERVGQLYADFKTAIALSRKYIPAAIARHVKSSIRSVIESVLTLAEQAAGLLAVLTAVGALLGGPPGAVAGWEVGMAIIEAMGLGFLALWIADAVIRVGTAFGSFFVAVWEARGSKDKLDTAAQVFAQAIGTLAGVLVEALLLWAMGKGIKAAMRALADTPLAREGGEQLEKFLEEESGKEKKGREPNSEWQACFLAGTLIATPAGPVPIEQLEANDQVLARRPDEGDIVAPYPITMLCGGAATRLVLIEVGGSRISATLNHRFYVADRGWVRARELALGDRLRSENDVALPITNISLALLQAETPTFNFHVAEVATYLLHTAAGAVLVHNGDTNNWNQTLYWLFQKKPNVRPGDTDGLSVWKTTSKEQVETFFKVRINVMSRSAKDAHSYFTEEQLRAEGLEVPQTTGEGQMAEYLEHHSIRPGNAPKYPEHLTQEQMTNLQETLGKLGKLESAKGSDFGCG